ncbi:hypothetical protein [Nocardioides sp. WS12]|uniref:hypothetical protein n=1 Tax=Nocardioides sp. WS12 TaxID=2486272 RepID=UPI0015FBE9AD|nr:hypothetical protein [Nocardioides sp. WS12]
MSAIENETTRETATFEHFGREWTIPAKRHLSHMRHMREEGRRSFGNIDLLLAETFLDAEQFEALCDIDPDEQALSDFGDKIGKTLGFGGSGNSGTS